jgi:hypothetical protein
MKRQFAEVPDGGQTIRKLIRRGDALGQQFGMQQVRAGIGFRFAAAPSVALRPDEFAHRRILVGKVGAPSTSAGTPDRSRLAAPVGDAVLMGSLQRRLGRLRRQVDFQEFKSGLDLVVIATIKAAIVPQIHGTATLGTHLGCDVGPFSLNLPKALEQRRLGGALPFTQEYEKCPHHYGLLFYAPLQLRDGVPEGSKFPCVDLYRSAVHATPTLPCRIVFRRRRTLRRPRPALPVKRAKGVVVGLPAFARCNDFSALSFLTEHAARISLQTSHSSVIFLDMDIVQVSLDCCRQVV